MIGFIAAMAMLADGAAPEPSTGVYVSCVLSEAKRLEPSAEPALAIADAALGSCADRESGIGQEALGSRPELITPEARERTRLRVVEMTRRRAVATVVEARLRRRGTK